MLKRDSAKRSKLHHAAFGKYFLGIRPDYVIEIRKDVLAEEDGPMLIHGLKELNNKKIILPSPRKLSRDPLLLELRYEEFRAAVPRAAESGVKIFGVLD
jgi:putative restriction endonuclease